MFAARYSYYGVTPFWDSIPLPTSYLEPGTRDEHSTEQRSAHVRLPESFDLMRAAVDIRLNQR
jgi:hypothetical protein